MNEQQFQSQLEALRQQIETVPEDQRARLREMADRVALVQRQSQAQCRIINDRRQRVAARDCVATAE